MAVFDTLSIDQVILAVLATAALREILPGLLPASVVGPNGWLLHIDDSER